MPRFLRIIWEDDADPDGNVQHIAQHALTIEDVEYVLENPESEDISKNSGRPCCFGYTPGGDYIIVVYDQIDHETIFPVTAYEVSER